MTKKEEQKLREMEKVLDTYHKKHSIFGLSPGVATYSLLAAFDSQILVQLEAQKQGISDTVAAGIK